jgi:hypothetical protein
MNRDELFLHRRQEHQVFKLKNQTLLCPWRLGLAVKNLLYPSLNPHSILNLFLLRSSRPSAVEPSSQVL